MNSINERKFRFSEKHAFLGKKNNFQEISIFSESFGLFRSVFGLVGAIGFLEAVDMD